MSQILVVDDTAIYREMLARVLRAQGHDVHTAPDGESALRVLGGHPFDLVMLDLWMPGLDGFAVLRAMRRNPRLRDVRVLVLTAASERAAVVQAAQAKVRGYLLKDAIELDALLARITQCLKGENEGDANAEVEHAAPITSPRSPSVQSVAESLNSAPLIATDGTLAPPPGVSKLGPQSCLDKQWQPLAAVTREEIDQVLDEALNIPPFGPTTKQIMAVTGSSQCTVEDIAKVVALDQALSIRLLKLANSSTYSRGRPLTSVRDAVQRIGIRDIRSLVMSLSVVDAYTTSSVSRPFFDHRMFWEHSIACGVAASQIARLLESARKDEFLMWGLLHDVGRVVLLEQLPERYEQVWTVARERGVPMEAVERKLLLLDHAEILKRAMERWQFVSDFITPVVSHHFSLAKLAKLGKGDIEPAATVAIANALVSALCIGSGGNEMIYPLQPLADLLGMRAEVLYDVAGRVDVETTNLRQVMLAQGNDVNWPSATERWRSVLPDRVNLFTASATGIDTFGLFFDRLNVHDSDQPPTAAVLHAPDVSGALTLFQQLRDCEERFHVSRVPVLLFCDGDERPELDAMDGRHVVLMTMPVRYDLLLNGVTLVHSENASAVASTVVCG